jgi:serine/threonine protein kinase
MKQISKKSFTNSYGMNVTTDGEQSSAAARREYLILKTLLASKDKDSRNMVIGLADFIEDNNDIWIVFEKAGSSLSNLNFKLKGEFYQGQRIYSIKKGYFLKFLFDDLNNLKILMRKLLKFINFLNTNGVIHCDLKPENILFDFDLSNIKKDSASVNQVFSKMKIIDFGSAFFIDNPENFSSNTPEYMSPEINEHMEKKTQAREMIAFLQSLKSHPWAIDIWSLGVSILEMSIACPLWMNYKAKVIVRGKVIYKTGLFGVNGRDGTKIYNKQVEVSKSVGKLMQDSLIVNETERSLLVDLLSSMLELDYRKRISPLKALEHPFLTLRGEIKKNNLDG